MASDKSTFDVTLKRDSNRHQPRLPLAAGLCFNRINARSLCMQLTIYQVDAFAYQQFKGNPAAVCLLDQWLEDRVLQNIAAENNLSETAFVARPWRHHAPRMVSHLCLFRHHHRA